MSEVRVKSGKPRGWKFVGPEELSKVPEPTMEQLQAMRTGTAPSDLAASQKAAETAEKAAIDAVPSKLPTDPLKLEELRTYFYGSEKKPLPKAETKRRITEYAKTGSVELDREAIPADPVSKDIQIDYDAVPEGYEAPSPTKSLDALPLEPIPAAVAQEGKQIGTQASKPKVEESAPQSKADQMAEMLPAIKEAKKGKGGRSPRLKKAAEEYGPATPEGVQAYLATAKKDNIALSDMPPPADMAPELQAATQEIRSSLNELTDIPGDIPILAHEAVSGVIEGTVSPAEFKVHAAQLDVDIKNAEASGTVTPEKAAKARSGLASLAKTMLKGGATVGALGAAWAVYSGQSGEGGEEKKANGPLLGAALPLADEEDEGGGSSSSSSFTEKAVTARIAPKISEPDDLDSFLEQLRSYDGALDPEDAKLYNKQLSDLVRLKASARKKFSEGMDRQQWGQTAELFTKGLFQIAAGAYGLKTGTDMAGIQWSAIDWKQNMEQLKARLANSLEGIDETKEIISDQKKKAESTEAELDKSTRDFLGRDYSDTKRQDAAYQQAMDVEALRALNRLKTAGADDKQGRAREFKINDKLAEWDRAYEGAVNKLVTHVKAGTGDKKAVNIFGELGKFTGLSAEDTISLIRQKRKDTPGFFTDQAQAATWVGDVLRSKKATQRKRYELALRGVHNSAGEEATTPTAQAASAPRAKYKPGDTRVLEGVTYEFNGTSFIAK